MKLALDFASDRPRRAIADDTEVDLSQSDAFCCRAAYKNFIRQIELVAGDG